MEALEPVFVMVWKFGALKYQKVLKRLHTNYCKKTLPFCMCQVFARGVVVDILCIMITFATALNIRLS